MVDLPPSVDELDEFGKFAFVSEMHVMATQILSRVTDDAPLSSHLKTAIEIIESELHSMRNVLGVDYEPPESSRVASLILRCVELYLEHGLWFDLCHGEMRLHKTHNEDSMDQIRNVFREAEIGDRYLMSSSMIDLTLSRVEMMTFFHDRLEALTSTVYHFVVDPDSHYTISVESAETPADRLVHAAVSDSFDGPNSTILCDDDYLTQRENIAWVYYRNLRLVGSIACLIYYLLFSAVAFFHLITAERKIVIAESVAVGLGVFVVISEIASLRICHSGPCPPKASGILYPGVQFYLVQYLAASLGAVILIVAIGLDGSKCGLGVIVLGAHHALALIVPWCLWSCFVEKHRRGDRVFNWLRLSFFRSSKWLAVRIVFCVLLTPGVYGVQMIIAYGLRNRPSVIRTPDEHLLVDV
jgi:hypothetical protein